MNNREWVEYDFGDASAYVDMNKWGKDHWSVFAYFEAMAVDNDGIIINDRMRCNSRLHREFAHRGSMMGGNESPTILKGGEKLFKHDDWSCAEDLAAHGIIQLEYRVISELELFGGTQARVSLSEKGKVLSSKLRKHKMMGGSFSDFSLDSQ